MKIYIAGKITGLDNYKKLFEIAEKRLTDEGNICMNPSSLPMGLKFKEYMHICHSMIDVCDKVYMLENWEDSPGARNERKYAILARIKVIYEKEYEKWKV